MRSSQLLRYGFLFFAGCCSQITSDCAAMTASATVGLPGRRVVRTTAFTHSHRAAAKNAKGSQLHSGDLNSAAADWSRFPLGTKFKIVRTNKIYVVDDYGPALVGTNKIDLYMASRREMSSWGVRNVAIDIIEPGSYDRSLALLRLRRSVPYVRRMLRALEEKVQGRRGDA
jgi:3D (Asp-Asp-Asp) domain-containing protein